MLKNQRHETFAQEYVLRGNASEAYRIAFPSCEKLKDENIWTRACRLLKNRKVEARVEELQKERSAVYEDASADVIGLLKRVIRGEEIQDYKSETTSDRKKATTVRTISVAWAVERICKMLGLDKPSKSEVSFEDSGISKISINVAYNKKEDLDLQERQSQ